MGRGNETCHLVKKPYTCTSIGRKTPYKAKNKKKPHLADIQEFGVSTYVKDLKARKLDSRAQLSHFVGYDLESKGCRIHWPGNGQLQLNKMSFSIRMMFEHLKISPLSQEIHWLRVLSLEFRWRCRVQSCARRWLQLIGCATLLMVASNFGGPDRVGESGVRPRRSLRQMRAS